MSGSLTSREIAKTDRKHRELIRPRSNHPGIPFSAPALLCLWAPSILCCRNHHYPFFLPCVHHVVPQHNHEILPDCYWRKSHFSLCPACSSFKTFICSLVPFTLIIIPSSNTFLITKYFFFFHFSFMYLLPPFFPLLAIDR
ncbi:unnamed protein product [Tuber aestivum]|uniref:Uncharacterized protein n=1 Tax=Tuber aestivum TaxID=59557 RepID=A0A292PSU6_9PEZI|nr:unnamed protein product [Tuber aestivum]